MMKICNLEDWVKVLLIAKESLMSMIVKHALDLIYSYLLQNYRRDSLIKIEHELLEITRDSKIVFDVNKLDIKVTYESLQEKLSKLNEKETVRKNNGVYYTPQDVVKFILTNTIKSAYGFLSKDNVGEEDLTKIPHYSFGMRKTIFDPTCGTGEFLLAALTMKFDLLEIHKVPMSKKAIHKVINTIRGNDINNDSVIITKLRILVCTLERFGTDKIIGISRVLNNCFTSYDYVTESVNNAQKYDIIVGNPPYVEDSKSKSKPKVKYGNIYANVLINSAKQLTTGGCIGFVVPLSYVSTPRMKPLRDELLKIIPEQYILSYADRPDCLFDSVHQKLCIIVGKMRLKNPHVYTGSYQYWYKNERKTLFSNTQVIVNKYAHGDAIPKLGNGMETSIYSKIVSSHRYQSVYELSRQGNESVYLNRREAFWMKAYRSLQKDPEYKIFSFNSPEEADYCYCLINSSLFWWYWISTSDCWHVSKELNGFRAPFDVDYERASILAKKLISKLEETKVYVGTKQIDYEYKHKDCIDEIRAIDKFINESFGLSCEEGLYIQNYAFKYRTSGGVEQDESN